MTEDRACLVREVFDLAADAVCALERHSERKANDAALLRTIHRLLMELRLAEFGPRSQEQGPDAHPN